jgi:hypothetical protein
LRFASFIGVKVSEQANLPSGERACVMSALISDSVAELDYSVVGAESIRTEQGPQTEVLAEAGLSIASGRCEPRVIFLVGGLEARAAHRSRVPGPYQECAMCLTLFLPHLQACALETVTGDANRITLESKVCTPKCTEVWRVRMQQANRSSIASLAVWRFPTPSSPRDAVH